MSDFALPVSTPRKRKLAPSTPNSGEGRKSPLLVGGPLAVTPEAKIHRYRSKSAVADLFAASGPTSVSFPAALLPTPLTVGSGRSKLQETGVPFKKSRSLSASLQALADEPECAVPTGDFSPGLRINFPGAVEETSSPGLKIRGPVQRPSLKSSLGSPALDELDVGMPYRSSASDDKGLERTSLAVTDCPQTPPQLTLKQAALFEDATFEDEGVEVVSLGDVQKIPRRRLSNPFLETKTPPRSENAGRIDLSKSIELIHHASGERKLQQMSEEQKRFKPRKLVFNEEPSSNKVNFNVANKFIGKSIGRNFTMHDVPGLAPGFKIYDDDDIGESPLSRWDE